MAHLWIPWHHWRKVGGSPIEATTQFVWCKHCQEEIEPVTSQGYFEGINVFKRACARCGQVTHWGVAQSVFRSPVPSILRAAMQWVRTCGVFRG
jgi:hypothetical protein